MNAEQDMSAVPDDRAVSISSLEIPPAPWASPAPIGSASLSLRVDLAVRLFGMWTAGKPQEADDFLAERAVHAVDAIIAVAEKST